MKYQANSKIIVSLKGGLGNQMFQYSLYLWLKNKDFNSYLDDHWYYIKKLKPHESIKLYYFGINNIELIDKKAVFKFYDFYDKKYIFPIFHLHKSILLLVTTILRRILRKIFIFLNFDYIKLKYYYLEDPKTGYNFVTNLNSFSKIYLDGTFSYNKIVEEIKDIIIKTFTFNNNIMPNIVSKIKDEINKNNSVGIHVRRGDFVGDKIRDVCNLNYYYNSIRFLLSKFDNLFFFIFSNDINYINNNFNFLKNFMIVDTLNTITPDYFDLFLMTQVNHIIISNSTFSWWAAYLNKNPDKIVIAPERFHSDDSWVPPDILYPPEWIKMSIS